MTTRTGYLKCTGILALIVALIALVIWITGMYRSSETNYLQTANTCLKSAADEDLRMRLFALGDKFKSRMEPKADTSTYITKTLRSEDTTIYIRIRRDDPTATTRVRYFYMQDITPLNTAKVDSLFKHNMAGSSLPVQASYVELIDLKKNIPISSNAPKGNLSGYLVSKTDTLDIFKTIGIKVYIKTPVYVILRPVMTEFVISIALLLVALGLIIKLIRDVRKLQREGFRLLRFISLKAEHSLRRTAQQVKEVSDTLEVKGEGDLSSELEKTREGVLIEAGYFERLGTIIKNEAGEIEFKKTIIPVKSLLDEMKAKYEQIIYKNALINVVAGDDLFIYTDEYYLRRILNELLDNCVRYSNDPVQIIMIAEQRDKKIIISVSNTGWGIMQEDLDNLFFVNHNLARLFKEGISKDTKTGLGLSFVHSFVRSLGGVVRINREDEITGIKLIFYLAKGDLKRIAKAKRQYQQNKVTMKPTP